MKVSKRIAGLTGGGSDGWDIWRKSRALKAQGIDVIELTVGEHDRRTEPEILNAMHAAAIGGHTGYSKLPGTDVLRDAVAARVTRRTGIPTSRDNVLITPGGQSALFAAHTAACDPGDRALFIDPFYATYPGTIRGTGAVAVPVAARAERGFEPAVEDILAAGNARSLLINSPNNPTGVVYSRATMESIARACRDHGMWLISDEVYDTQIWEGEHLSPRQLPDMAERTMVIGSMSKSHAMTGSRLGWIVAAEDVIGHLANLSTHTTYGVPGFIQDAALFALEQGPDLEAKIAEPFRRRRDLIQQLLSRRGLPFVPPKGAMYIMLDIRASGLSGEAFAHRLLDEHRIATMPGESFGKAAAGHLRVALTIDDARLTEAIRTICDLYDTTREAAA